MFKQETPYDGILSHLKDGSFLVLECSERVDVSPDKSYVILYHTAIYLFDTSGFLYRMSGHFCHTADHSLKLKPRGCHTATTRKSGQTRKVVSVCLSVRRQRLFREIKGSSVCFLWKTPLCCFLIFWWVAPIVIVWSNVISLVSVFLRSFENCSTLTQ